MDKFFEHKLRLKFEGIYKDGKRYIGWEYNLEGELIFVGEYKSDLYWKGYFYKSGEFMHQKKSGFIEEGNGTGIKIYDSFKKLIFEGSLKKGKINYLEFEFLKEEIIEYRLIKDIDLNYPYEKRLEIVTTINLFRENKKIKGDKAIRRFIPNQLRNKTNYMGEIKNGKYYTGRENIWIDYCLRTERIFENGNMVKVKKYDNKCKKLI